MTTDVCIANRSSTCRHRWSQMPPLKTGKLWLNHTFCVTARVCCSRQYCWVHSSMADALGMTDQELDSQMEILQTFQGLQTILDKSLNLAPDPRQSKRRKEGAVPNGVAQNPVDTQPKVAEMMQLMARLLLRHEMEIQGLHQADTFVMFCSKQPEGILQVLIKETQAWKSALETSPLPRAPLRQHLFQALLTDLLNRVTRISKCQKGDVLLTTLQQKGLLMEDYSWPYLAWDPKAKLLKRNEQKKPITMVKLMEHVGELIEMARNPSLIMKFQALGSGSEQQVVPWRLQINMRHDAPWDLLMQLTHNSMWVLLRTSLKPHSQMKSNLAVSLLNMLTPSNHKGKGLGKGKKGNKQPAS